MHVQARHPLFTMFEVRLKLSDREVAAIEAVPIRLLSLGADQDIVREGDRPSRCVLVIEGFACTSKIVGEAKRQIMAVHIAGDLPDLQGLHLDLLDSDVRTLTPCTVGFMDHAALRRLCEDNPRLAAALWRVTLVDAAIFREWVANVGQRPALSRLAHFFCEMEARLAAIGEGRAGSCRVPLTQVDLSEATGLSTVHVNRMLQELRRSKLISFQDGLLTIHDRRQLYEVADFRAEYLHLDPRPAAGVASTPV